MKNRSGKERSTSHSSAAGFSLVELLVAMAIFLIIGGAAVTLVQRHVPIFTAQQNQTALNLAMRNAVAQMQIDVVNAGTGYYQGVNILSVDQNTPPSNPSDLGANCVSTTSSSLFITPVGTTTLAQLAADFHTGDQLLLVKSDGSQMTTTILTGDGLVTGGKVKLPHNPTAVDGTNTSSADPLALSNSADSNKLGVQFCNTDWVLKLAPITYQVDASDPTNPKLTRTQGGQTNVISEQIIGFKVGAAIWNGTTDSTYNFDAKTYSTPFDWSLIRAIRVSMIGRTPADVKSNFRNSFDGG